MIMFRHPQLSQLGMPIFEKRSVHTGIAQIAFDPSCPPLWNGQSRALFWVLYYHFYAENNLYELLPYRQYFSTSPLGRSNLSGLLSFLSL